METEFNKCEHCGTWHEIKTTTFGGVPVKTCPYIPSSITGYWYTGLRDPDEENPISASYNPTLGQDRELVS
jgi:hypothetical protein